MDCCRTCLAQLTCGTPINALDIDNFEIMEKLSTLLPEIVWSRPGFSTIICPNCLEKLRISYEFKIQCLQSDSNLQLNFQQYFPLKDHLLDEFLFVNAVKAEDAVMEEPSEEPSYANLKPVSLDEVEPLDDTSNSYIAAEFLEFDMTEEDPDDEPQEQTTPVVCPKCNEEFPSLSKLNIHRKSMHIYDWGRLENNGLICNICDQKNFENEAQLTVHTWKHEGKDLSHCPLCNGEYKSIFALEEHILQRRCKRRFCDTCRRTFLSEAALRQHMRQHDQSLAECPVCQKSFRSQSFLDKHMVVHSDDKPYQCLFCEKRFNQEVALKGHMKGHTCQKPFSCTLCNKKFAEASEYVSHTKTKKHINVCRAIGNS